MGVGAALLRAEQDAVGERARPQWRKFASDQIQLPQGMALLASPALRRRRLLGAAGWSSLVARQAHNLKVVGSNPTPATTSSSWI